MKLATHFTPANVDELLAAATHKSKREIERLARGGDSTASNLRLRCPAHNPFEAERAYGAAFMENKRAAAAAG